MNAGQLTFETMVDSGFKPVGKCYANATENHGRGEEDAVLLSRRNDPDTSVEAARKLCRNGELGRQEQAVFEVLKLNDGSTSAELAQKVGGDRYKPSRRLSGIERKRGIEGKRLISRGRTRICHATGNRCLAWWVLNGTERV